MKICETCYAHHRANALPEVHLCSHAFASPPVVPEGPFSNASFNANPGILEYLTAAEEEAVSFRNTRPTTTVLEALGNSN